jgi:small-conductance mechanosensitive channel
MISGLFVQAPQDSEGATDAAPPRREFEVESFSDFGTFLMGRLDAYWDMTVRHSPKIVLCLIVLVLTWAAARGIGAAIRMLAQRAGARRSLADVCGLLGKLFVWFVGAFMALSILFPSLNPGSIVTGLGIGGVIIGIAFKDIFENFMAGILIMMRRAMRMGDYIDSGDVQGRIEKITLRDTYLRRTDGELVLTPNAHLFKNPVRVWTDPDQRRYEIVVGVAYDEDVDQAREVIQSAMDSLDFNQRKKPEVYAREFNSSSIDFTVRWWADPEPLDMHRSRDQVVSAIKRALDDAGIEIPFPYRTLTFKEPLRLHGQEQEDEPARQAAE